MLLLLCFFVSFVASSSVVATDFKVLCQWTHCVALQCEHGTMAKVLTKLCIACDIPHVFLRWFLLAAERASSARQFWMAKILRHSHGSLTTMSKWWAISIHVCASQTGRTQTGMAQAHDDR
jgi:hypothetical protein